MPELHESFFLKIYHKTNLKIPRILTLDDLAFGFILWMIACGISTIGFVAEHSRLFVKKILIPLILWLKDVVGVIFMLYLIKNRVNVH